MISLNKLSFGLFSDFKSYSKKETQKEAKEINKKLNIHDIIQVDFPHDQYYRYQTSKNQIVLHHTVSGHGVSGDINYWRSTVERVATHIIIDWTGKIYQCYSSKYWGHHLGIKNAFIEKMGTTKSNVYLNEHSIGIEIDAWGGLVRYKRLWYPAKWDKKLKRFVANTSLRPVENVQVYENGFRGFYGFEKYTAEQIEALRELLVFWNEKYGIPLNYHEDMWDVSKNALNGVDGIWTHVSYRTDKSDCHPQPELIQMLKNLK